MARKKRISRRAMLRGAGGVALGLPFLEIMSRSGSKAQDDGIPKRFLVAVAGSSLGRW